MVGLNSLKNVTVLLPLLLLLLFCFALPIGDSSEAREAQVAWSIVNSDQWILPLRNGIVPSKPPMAHWVAAAASTIGQEITPGIARLPAFIAGLGVLLSIFTLVTYLARLTHNFSEDQGRVLGFCSVLTLGSSYGFVRLMSDARVDMFFTLWVVLALSVVISAFTKDIGTPSRFRLVLSPSKVLAFYLCLSFAVLSKGPLGAVLPCLIGLSMIFAIAGLRPCFSLIFRPILGWIPFLLVVGGYYYLATLHSPVSSENLFLKRQVWLENLERLTGGEIIDRKPVWFYIPAFIRLAFPWSLVFIAVLWNFVRPPRPRNQATRLFNLIGAIWVIVGVVLFSLAAGKRDSYLLPLLPGIALGIAPNLYYWVEQRWSEKKGYLLENCLLLFSVLGIIALSACLGAISLIAWPASDIRSQSILWLSQNKNLIAVSILFILSPLIFGLTFKSDEASSQSRVALFSVACVMVLISVTSLGLGVKRHLKYFYIASREINQIVDKSERILTQKPKYLEYFDPYFFYLSRKVDVLSFKDTLPSKFRGYFLLHSRTYRRLRLDSHLNLRSRVKLRIRQFDRSSADRSRNEVVLAKVRAGSS